VCLLPGEAAGSGASSNGPGRCSDALREADDIKAFLVVDEVALGAGPGRC